MNSRTLTIRGEFIVCAILVLIAAAWMRRTPTPQASSEQVVPLMINATSGRTFNLVVR